MGNQKVSIFLTFNGKAEEAMQFYAAVLPDAKITRLERYEKKVPHANTPEDEKRVLHGALSFMGQEIIFLDMNTAFTAPAFSWSTSIMVACKDEPEFDAIFGALSKDGSVMMGPESVGPIRKCAWVTDKFGVTWQPVWE